MKKKVAIISFIILIVISLILLLIYLKTNNKINYYDLLKEKLSNTYSLKVQISKLSDSIKETDLNYEIEGDNFSLSLYKIENEKTTNYFFQKYNGKYYKDDKEITEFDYSNYEIYIDIIKYIEDIKLEDKTYKGIISSSNLKDIIKTNKDGEVFLEIDDNIIKTISIISDEYTINIDYN